jgi:hypothetical protein
MLRKLMEIIHLILTVDHLGLEWAPGTSAGGREPGTCPCGRSVSE